MSVNTATNTKSVENVNVKLNQPSDMDIHFSAAD